MPYANMPTDIQIGTHFASGGRLFRCTDVGSRVIVAIRITEVEVTVVRDHHHTTEVIDVRKATKWGRGPSYALAEIVFDEDDYGSMSVVPEAEVEGWTP